jgi:hypothetical protein
VRFFATKRGGEKRAKRARERIKKEEKKGEGSTPWVVLPSLDMCPPFPHGGGKKGSQLECLNCVQELGKSLASTINQLDDILSGGVRWAQLPYSLTSQPAFNPQRRYLGGALECALRGTTTSHTEMTKTNQQQHLMSSS